MYLVNNEKLNTKTIQNASAIFVKQLLILMKKKKSASYLSSKDLTLDVSRSEFQAGQSHYRNTKKGNFKS